jgi:hypothetical protein
MTMRMMLLALVASVVMVVTPAQAQPAPVAPQKQGTVKALRYIRMVWYNQTTWRYRVMTVDTTTGQITGQDNGSGQPAVMKLMMHTTGSSDGGDTGVMVFPCGNKNSDVECAGDIPTETVEVNPAGEPKEHWVRFARKLATDYNTVVMKKPDIAHNPAVNPILNRPVNPAANPTVNPAVKPLPQKH